LEIIEIPYLLSQEKCSYVIELAKKHGILNSKNDTSLNANFIIEYDEHDDDVLDSIENSISSQIGISVKNFECLQVVRYNVDGNIKPHYDWLDVNDEKLSDELKEEGNKTHSCLVYLNDNFSGGETYFINENKKIIPKKGKGLIWTNIKNGECLYESLHEGLPVTEGEKWILVTWIRENEIRKNQNG
jgi:prolyl 4-hydroxylase